MAEQTFPQNPQLSLSVCVFGQPPLPATAVLATPPVLVTPPGVVIPAVPVPPPMPAEPSPVPSPPDPPPVPATPCRSPERPQAQSRKRIQSGADLDLIVFPCSDR